jgi:hypothetical protein
MSGISASRHHADWLSLVEVSGPFVSLPVLLKTFPQGLDPRDQAKAKALRAAYEDWGSCPKSAIVRKESSMQQVTGGLNPRSI